MTNLVKKGVLAATLAASALVASAPAEARPYYGHRGGGDDAAIAIGAGVIGLALGAAIASDHNDRYYDDGYYYPRYRTQYYYNSYPAYPVYRGYYYNNYRAYPAYRGYYRNYDNRGWRGDRGHEWREHHGGRGW